MIFAAAEKLIFIIVVVILSILHSWWKKKRGEPDEEDSPWPGYPPRHKPEAPPVNRPVTQAPPKSPTASWEEELRRLLQGDAPARPTAPPVVVQPAPSPLVVVQPSRSAPIAPRRRAQAGPASSGLLWDGSGYGERIGRPDAFADAVRLGLSARE